MIAIEIMKMFEIPYTCHIRYITHTHIKGISLEYKTGRGVDFGMGLVKTGAIT